MWAREESGSDVLGPERDDSQLNRLRLLVGWVRRSSSQKGDLRPRWSAID